MDDEEGALCFYATSGKNPNTKLLQGEADNTHMGDVIVWFENKTFKNDFYNMLWDIWDREKKKNLYCVVQYLELKPGVKPTIHGTISRTLIEDEYDLIGYGVIKMNDEFAKFTFGTFTIPLYDGPIYVEECLPNKKNDKVLKITIDQPGEIIHPVNIPKPTKPLPKDI